MIELKSNEPDVYDDFKREHHTVRRSERLWAGLSTDLMTEQVLRRNIKTTGGLTRGRDMSELQRLACMKASATEVSEKIVESMKGQNIKDYSFQLL